MEITNLKEKWGIRIEATAQEVLSLSPDFLRNLGYEKHFILFKGLGKISEQEIYNIVSRFGRPWSKQEYQYSNEVAYDIEDTNAALSSFSNSNQPRLAGIAMPWHADIPIWKGMEFPWRCLYNTRNDNPNAGFTSWMSLMLDHINPSVEELDYFSRIKILNQSWHGHQGEEYLNSFIKEDPITRKQSLRANYFVAPGWSDKAWIKETYVDDKKVDNLETLGKIYKLLSSRQDLVYQHKWTQYDCIIYNNWSFVHNRTTLELLPGQDRVFTRTNIAHLSNEEWDRFKII
jgi:alpha-ketoglutarate-dependent taurine dioxygenase